ncbi:MAG: hypothetical protein JWN94_1021 [Betaproteobacteria bacterium]|nr:hypothetical protein [Betaproteobacteria bacterium]
MCSPVLALAAVTTAMQYVKGQQDASSAASAAQANLNAQATQTGIQQQQINNAAANETTERAKQAMIEQAKLRTISGESGVGGISSDRLLADSAFQEGYDITGIESNRVNRVKQTNALLIGYQANAQSQANAAYNKAPSALGAGLQIATDIAKDPDVKKRFSS